MNKLLFSLLGFLTMYAVDDDSAAPVDRGDDIKTADDKAADAAAAAKAVDDAAAAKEAEDAAAAGKTDNNDEEDDTDDVEDPAEEGEGEGEEGDDKKQGRAKDGKFTKKEPTIPKARFDEMRTKAREREKALLDQIDQFAKDAKAASESVDTAKVEKEVEELELKLEKQLNDGESAAARATLREIRMKERQIIEQQVEHKSDKARQLALEQFRVDTLLERLEAEFPVINPDAEQYSQEIVEEIVLLRTGFERGGMSSSAAITKAVKYVLGASAKKEEAAAEPEGKKGLRDDAKSERKQKQIEKNIDAANKQPAKTTEVGADSHKKGGGADSKTIDTMTEEEFNALPSSTKARLRGDFVEETAS